MTTTKTKAADMSIKIRYSFAPIECGEFTFDAQILMAFFKSDNRCSKWWSHMVLKTQEIGDVMQVDAPVFTKGELWPYSVRVVKRAPDEYARIAMAVRVKSICNVSESESMDKVTA